MVFHQQVIYVLRLVLAAFLGGIIGLERETVNRPAGLRTHTLVSVGAALAMLVSISIPGADPARIAAQVISGIGFLGAGTILREGAGVRGLTTAASLWVVACIGLAVGSGLYLSAVIGTILMFLTLLGLKKIEESFFKRPRHHLLQIQIIDRPGQLGILGTALGQINVDIRSIELKQLTVKDVLLVEMLVLLPPLRSLNEVITQLARAEGVIRVEEV